MKKKDTKLNKGRKFPQNIRCMLKFLNITRPIFVALAQQLHCVTFNGFKFQSDNFHEIYRDIPVSITVGSAIYSDKQSGSLLSYQGPVIHKDLPDSLTSQRNTFEPDFIFHTTPQT